VTKLREDLLLLLSAVALGIGGAAIFAAYRAATASGGGAHIDDFAMNLAWPGVLIFLAVAAVVWFGWKAELD
jgi:hypothetical protein